MNTRLGTDHHHVIMSPIRKDCKNICLKSSFFYNNNNLYIIGRADSTQG